MAKFVVLDHSLRFVGGHYYEYAVQMMQAADRAAWQPSLGAHWDLGQEAELRPSTGKSFARFAAETTPRF